jgi:hypothetical protein
VEERTEDAVVEEGAVSTRGDTGVTGDCCLSLVTLVMKVAVLDCAVVLSSSVSSSISISISASAGMDGDKVDVVLGLGLLLVMEGSGVGEDMVVRERVRETE